MNILFVAHQQGHKVTGTADTPVVVSTAKGQWMIIGAGISLYLALLNLRPW